MSSTKLAVAARALARRPLPRATLRPLMSQCALSTTSVLRGSARPSDSGSPIAPLGIEAAEKAASDPTYKPTPKIFDEFALTDRVGVITGGNAGIGLEIALAFCEAGARAVYCLDVSPTPSDEWTKCRDFVQKLGNGSRLEYVTVDVRDQQGMWKTVEEIGDREQRVDMCVANAGVLRPPIHCMDVTTAQFQEVMDINVNGVLYTAQAAGRQMSRFGRPGSIITIGSISGSLRTTPGSRTTPASLLSCR